MRDAATVILLREDTGGLQVYLLQRVQTMAFASGMHVFPGGTVDPRDAGTAVPLPEHWPERLHADPGPAAALVGAAIRETFGETGVLVATTAQARPSWDGDRLALLRHETSLAQVLPERHRPARRAAGVEPLDHAREGAAPL